MLYITVPNLNLIKFFYKVLIEIINAKLEKAQLILNWVLIGKCYTVDTSNTSTRKISVELTRYVPARIQNSIIDYFS